MSSVAFSLFGIDIYWYGVLYVISLLIIKKLVYKFCDFFSISSELIELGIARCVIFGVIFARIFDVIVYSTEEFINNPLMIFKIRNGGLSFHGSIIGIVINTIIFSKRYNLNHMKVFDLVAIFSPICIFFVRIGNYINGELIGRFCAESWYSIRIENDHFYPSQIFESITEGLLSFLILFGVFLNFYKKKINYKNDLKKNSKFYLSNNDKVSLYFFDLHAPPGVFLCIFLFLYGVFRFFCEFFRMPEVYYCLFNCLITIGQILSIKMIVLSIFLYNYIIKK